MNHLKFVKSGELEYDVFEVYTLKTWMKPPANPTSFYSGLLRFGTGHDEGWHFMSSDCSINWNLGPNLKRAQAELRKRYRDGQKRAKARKVQDSPMR